MNDDKSNPSLKLAMLQAMSYAMAPSLADMYSQGMSETVCKHLQKQPEDIQQDRLDKATLKQERKRLRNLRNK